MTGKTILLFTAYLIILPLTNLHAQGEPATMEQKKHTQPFLITGKMPHLTKLLMKQWDSPDLALTDQQKEKLLKVRQVTKSGAKRLISEIEPLEQQVAGAIFAGKTPEELKPVVDRIAALKSEATMLHLRCIADTAGILDPKQLALLTGRTAQ